MPPTTTRMASTTNNSTTDQSIETVSHTWTIGNFTNLSNRVFSSPFSLNEHEFSLYLDSVTSIFDLNHVILGLYYNQHEDELYTRYRVSILNSNGEKKCTREFCWNYHKSDHETAHFNLTNYTSREKCSSYLVDNNLRIHCEVDVFKKNHTYFMNRRPVNFQPFLNQQGELSDVTLVVEGKEFEVHKIVLAAQSSVFKELLEKESENPVEINDISLEVFELLIKFLYGGEIPDLSQHATDLLITADKYQIVELKSICEQALVSSLTINSASRVLVLADVHAASYLKSNCIEFIICHSEEVMATDGWKRLLETNRIELVAELFRQISLKTKACIKSHGE